MSTTTVVKFKDKHYEIKTSGEGQITGRVRVTSRSGGWHWQKMPAVGTVTKIVAMMESGDPALEIKEVDVESAGVEVVLEAVPKGVSLDAGWKEDDWWVPTWEEAKKQVPVAVRGALGLVGLSADMKTAYYRLQERPWFAVKVINENT
tara:strand:+ start:25359 stop:25802 length:444 start_codon:yes stop_codon:yes gene_type:complete